ncbi:carbon-nitrogen hydrolase family protein [Pseudomonas gingeri]|uniref:nitrilase-related carbon-nitrogen hydrolase n=1 Tax=Pseudomonas gingeri TaxID=117681 RepID=UPI0015A22D1F|nr:nitrilase-related carbon-nitrogen hydrolase [Pseudomonas gingeri]NVZ62079.1 carbon-nitrogen hydrolase family protein [Pseudomonas gingeri]NVZ79038.1 carbon-nitrogen hydrolase family protein [Pseudomonas gingeri]
MRKLLVGTFLIALIAALTSYGVWTQQRTTGHYLSDLRIKLAVNQGVPGEHGNLLGIQPELFPSDYQSLPRLHRKLAAYLQQARNLGLLNARTVVVLPEHVGTWLVLRGEKDDLYQAINQQEAMNWLMVSNPLKFTGAVFKAKGRSRLDDARLRMKARTMANDYQALFGGLAKEFGITLVAGSILLPTPIVEQGTLKVGRGSLYNASLAFGADGRPMGQPQRQLYPTFEQRGYVLGASDQPLNVVDTPAGRLGILIGSDSWYPSAYGQLDALGVKLVAVPAFVAGKSSWDKPWRGFKNAVTPPDVSLRPGELSEGEAWHRLTLIGRAPGSQSIAGISVFLRGQLWDQRSSGQSFISYNGQTLTQDDAGGRGARLLNLWLP